MTAVIKTGGKQYLVKKGDIIKIEKTEGKIGKKLIFDEVLLLDDKIGQPLVEGAKVEGKILKQARAKKVIIFKHKAKKRYHKKRGHRQYYTAIQILNLYAKA